MSFLVRAEWNCENSLGHNGIEAVPEGVFHPLFDGEPGLAVVCALPPTAVIFRGRPRPLERLRDEFFR